MKKERKCLLCDKKIKKAIEYRLCDECRHSENRTDIGFGYFDKCDGKFSSAHNLGWPWVKDQEME